MVKFVQRKRLILLAIIFLLLSACSKKPEYHRASYTEEEMRAMFQDNKELFDKLVEVIISEQDFFEKGRRDEYEDAILMSPYDEELDLFSESGRQTVLDFFELKPYMISYDSNKRFIEITFVIQGDKESAVFLYWLHPMAPGEHGGESKLEEYIFYIGQNHYVDSLEGNWFFCKLKEPENRGPFESNRLDEDDE